MTDPVADPVLKQAREEIEAVIRKYDIGAHVVLHRAPGKCEHFANYMPSYSILNMVDTGIRIRSKLEEYGGDTERQKRDIEATVNMVEFFADILDGNAKAFAHLKKVLDKQFQPDHTPTRFQPDPKKGAH